MCYQSINHDCQVAQLIIKHSVHFTTSYNQLLNSTVRITMQNPNFVCLLINRLHIPSNRLMKIPLLGFDHIS